MRASRSRRRWRRRNAVMGIEGHGPLAKQVENLLTELGVVP